MLEIFTPYLGFISFFLTIVINIVLLWKNAPWWSYIIGNAIVPIILLTIGFSTGDLYNFIGDIIVSIIDMFKSIFDGIFS